MQNPTLDVGKAAMIMNFLGEELNTVTQPFNSQDPISNSPCCLPYSSYEVSLENLKLDQPVIP